MELLIDRLKRERNEVISRIEEIEKTLEVMPKDTVLGVLCMKAYLSSAKKKLRKIEEELISVK